MKFAVRPMHANDEAAVIGILNHHFPRVGMTHTKLHARLARGAKFFVAEENGAVIGFADVRVGWRALLRGLAVQAEKRGRGVGSALVQAAIGEAHALGFRRLWVEALAGDLSVLAFYENSGFVSRMTSTNNFGESVCVLSRTL